jgi:hypothetical protein
MASPTLLGLPREIRDRVIELAISHHAVPLRVAKEAPGWKPYADIHYYSPTQGHGVYYPSPVPEIATYSLLAVCHQLRAETLDACRRLSMTCECDVALLEEEDLFATFTYVPPLTRPHPQLKRSDFNVTFTIRQTGPAPAQTNGFFDQSLQGNDMPGRTLCYLIALFEHFIRCGPAPSKSPNHDRNHPITQATINIVQGDEGQRKGILPDFVQAHDAPEWRDDNPADLEKLIHPKVLADMMVAWFWVCVRLLGQPQRKDLGYLMKRIHTVEFRVDDTTLHTMQHSPPDGEWVSDEMDHMMTVIRG